MPAMLTVTNSRERSPRSAGDGIAVRRSRAGSRQPVPGSGLRAPWCACRSIRFPVLSTGHGFMGTGMPGACAEIPVEISSRFNVLDYPNGGLSHEAGGRDACPPKRAPRPVVEQREFSRPSRFQPRDGPHRRIGIDEKPVARDVVAEAGKRTQGVLRGDVHRLFADKRRHGDALRGIAAAGHALSRVREHPHAGDPRSNALVHLAVRPAPRTRGIAEQRAGTDRDRRWTD